MGGSGKSYRGTSDGYSGYRRDEEYYSPPPADPDAARRRREAEEAAQRVRDAERAERVRQERERAKSALPPHERQREQRNTRGLFDRDCVRNKITRPHPDARKVTILMVDNSGSNRVTARRIRESSGHILASMGIILGEKTQLALVYGSDHCDGSALRQDVDFVFPDELGDRIVLSTTSKVHDASGGDEAEAFECLLYEVCDTDFGHVQKADRHLILATDVVGHGMGLHSDDGCPFRRRWQDAVARVYQTFGTFQVIGTSENLKMGTRQAQFLQPDRVRYDLLDMSLIRSAEHRLGIIPSAALFLMARNDGPQTAKLYLQFLYEKWLRDPIFGQDTDVNAREAISRFLPYIEGMNPQMQSDWEEAIFKD